MSAAFTHKTARRSIRRGVGLVAAAVAVVTVLATAPAAAQATPTCDGLPATIIGTDGDDVLDGTNGNDVIVGLGGNDLIRGLDGRDRICGGDGRDRIFGGRQADRIFGGDGLDRLNGEAGRDFLDGGRGNDRLIGGGGDDTLLGARGNRDTLVGRSGNDTCTDPKATSTRYFDCEAGVPQVTVSPISITRTSQCADTECPKIAPTIFVTYNAAGRSDVVSTGAAQTVITTIDEPQVYDLGGSFDFNPGWTVNVFVREDLSARTMTRLRSTSGAVSVVVPATALDPELRIEFTVDLVLDA